MDSWRDTIDPMVRDHIEVLINESVKHRDSYKLAGNTANAQLWCALGLMQKQVFDLNLKIKFLEKVLKEIGSKGRKKDSGEKIDAAKALKDVLSRL